jgi:hypothetical protein
MFIKIDNFLFLVVVATIIIPAVSIGDSLAQLPVPSKLSSTTNATSLVPGVKIIAANPVSNKTMNVTISHTSINGSAPPGITVVVSALEAPDFILQFLNHNVTNAKNMSLPQQATTQSNFTKIIRSQLSSTKILTGSNVLNAGWASPESVIIRLEGNTTLDRVNLVQIQVVPLTSR